MTARIQVVQAGMLPDPDPTFEPEFMRRERLSQERTAKRVAEIEAEMNSRFSRVWRIRNSASRVMRFWHRLMFLLGR